jgi:hypothetical protein
MGKESRKLKDRITIPIAKRCRTLSINDTRYIGHVTNTMIVIYSMISLERRKKDEIVTDYQIRIISVTICDTYISSGFTV